MGYTEDSDNTFQVTTSHALINRFISSFWSNPEWLFEILIDYDLITYSIRPYS